ncbi:hypothetical protein H2248_004307 [Termitomyces sp. 'cryptogamus']|nr:hypothetical protein H2248_004307 [Termitomyces sp. 'cryptogamus']
MSFNFPRIIVYNANPLTLLGQWIQTIYEGSFEWLANATHPFLAGDYYMEEDDCPGPIFTENSDDYMEVDNYPDSPPKPFLDPPLPTLEQRFATLALTSTPDVTSPSTLYPSPCVAPAPSEVLSASFLLSPVARYCYIEPHTFFAEDDDRMVDAYPDQTPFPEQKSATSMVLASTPNVTSPSTSYPSSCVAPTPSVILPAPFCSSPTVAAEGNFATPALETPDKPSPSGKIPHYYETDYYRKDDREVPRDWRTLTTQSYSSAPDISSASTTRIRLIDSSEVSRLELPSYEDESQVTTPHDFLDLPSLPPERLLSPELSEQYLLPPLESESQRKRRSQKLDSVHRDLLSSEPQRRRKRHRQKFSEIVEAQDEEFYGLSGRKSTVRFCPTDSYHHSHRRKSRRKDRIYDRTETDTYLQAFVLERRDEYPPLQLLVRPLTPHLQYKELPSIEDHHNGHHQKSPTKERIDDGTDADVEYDAPPPERHDETPPPQRLVRPPTPHPRHRELPSADSENVFGDQADELLNRIEEQILRMGSTLRELKEEEERRHDPEGGISVHDARKKERKERRGKRNVMQRRSAPYASRSSATRSELENEDRNSFSEKRGSRIRERDSLQKSGRIKVKKSRKRGTSQGVDDETLGLSALSLAQPQATSTDSNSSHSIHPSAESWDLGTLSAALSELGTFQQAGPNGGALQLGSLAAALPVVQQVDAGLGESSILLRDVQLNVEPGSSEDQGQGDVAPSITQTTERNGVEDLSNSLIPAQLANETPEQEQIQTPLTIRIPSMALLQAQLVARNATVMETPSTHSKE